MVESGAAKLGDDDVEEELSGKMLFISSDAWVFHRSERTRPTKILSANIL